MLYNIIEVLNMSIVCEEIHLLFMHMKYLC